MTSPFFFRGVGTGGERGSVRRGWVYGLRGRETGMERNEMDGMGWDGYVGQWASG